MSYSPDVRPMMTIRDVARLLNIHINTARRWSDLGIIKCYRIAKRGDRRFLIEDVTRFLENYDDFNAKKSSVRNYTGS